MHYLCKKKKHKGRAGSIGILIKLHYETEKTSFANGGPLTDSRREAAKPVDYKSGELSNLLLSSEFHHIIGRPFPLYFNNNQHV